MRVGRSSLAGNFSAKWESPGMERTSCGVGTSFRTSGRGHVRAQSNGIEASPFKGVTSRFLMIMVSVFRIPFTVDVMRTSGVRSSSAMLSSFGM